MSAIRIKHTKEERAMIGQAWNSAMFLAQAYDNKAPQVLEEALSVETKSHGNELVAKVVVLESLAKSVDFSSSTTGLYYLSQGAILASLVGREWRTHMPAKAKTGRLYEIWQKFCNIIGDAKTAHAMAMERYLQRTNCINKA